MSGSIDKKLSFTRVFNIGTCALVYPDIAPETGWPDALRLVWRLDEIFR